MRRRQDIDKTQSVTKEVPFGEGERTETPERHPAWAVGKLQLTFHPVWNEDSL
jgi:hypothetical protein